MWGHGRTLSFQQEVGQRDQMSLCVQGCQVRLGQWGPRHKSPNGVTKGGAGSLALPGWTSESASPHPHPSPNPSAHVPQPHWTTRAGPWTMCWVFAGSHNHRHDHRSVNADIWSLLEDKCAEFKQKAHTHAQVSPAKNTFIMFLGLLYI